MIKVKITVLKTTLDRELAEEYGVEGQAKYSKRVASRVFRQERRYDI